MRRPPQGRAAQRPSAGRTTAWATAGLWLGCALLPAAAQTAASADETSGCLAEIAPLSEADGAAAFHAGLHCFRSRDHAAALAAFQRARAAGHDEPNLDFNLGLSHYRLGQFNAAAAHFERLREAALHAPLAEYHLGLIAARQGRLADAERHFLKVEHSAADTALRELLRTARQRLGLEPAQRVPQLYLFVGGGYDGNPALVGERLDPIRAAEGHAFSGISALAQWPLPAQAGPREIRLGGYGWFYGGIEGFDQLGVDLRLAWHRQWGPWQARLGTAVDVAWLDGDFLQTLLHADVEAQRGLGRGLLQWRAQSSLVRAAREYDLLDGWRLRLGARASQPLRGGLRGYVDYEFELNDRRDLAVTPLFYSQSPLRHQLQLGLSHGHAHRLLIDWRLRYRHSRFRNDNLLPAADGDPANPLTWRRQARRDRLLAAGVELRRHLGGATTALLEYRYERNDSGSRLFEYRRHYLMLGLEWMP